MQGSWTVAYTVYVTTLFGYPSVGMEITQALK